MKKHTTEQRWIVAKDNDNETTYYVEDTLRYTRTDSIKQFIYGTKEGWRYWRLKHGYKCIKVTVTFNPINTLTKCTHK